MLRRQKIILALLADSKRTLVRPAVGNLVFLLRQETMVRSEPAGHDFVPFRDGPYSFTLERDLEALTAAGFLSSDGGRLKLGLQRAPEARRLITQLPDRTRTEVEYIAKQYSRMSREALQTDVTGRYSAYVASARGDAHVGKRARPVAFFTAGYEGCSIDRFFNGLLHEGIRMIADVRANPMSRKFGFGRTTLTRVADQLGLDYRGFPTLGIPSRARAGLDGFASYQRLLDSYERNVLQRRNAEIAELAKLVQREPTVLICKEQDVRCCHRSRLASEVARLSGLPVRHLERL